MHESRPTIDAAPPDAGAAQPLPIDQWPREDRPRERLLDRQQASLAPVQPWTLARLGVAGKLRAIHIAQINDDPAGEVLRRSSSRIFATRTCPVFLIILF